MDTTTSAATYDQLNLSLLSLGGVALILVIVLPGAALAGYVTGRATFKHRRQRGEEVDSRIGETTIGAFFGILGLLLAFSFGNALAKNAANKLTLVNEAAALGTAFLRTDYLPEAGREELQVAIHAYAQTRIIPSGRTIYTREQAHEFLDRTLRAQALLWPLTVKHTADPVPPPVKTFFASAMNEALDAHLHRMRTLSEPISVFSQLMLLGSTIVALFLSGNRSGLTGKRLTWRTYVLAGFFAILMVTIVDIGRPEQGLIRVDDSPLRATILEMEIALGI